RDVGVILDAVFRFAEDFNLRMIRPHVALSAIFRHARRCGTERMPSMARGATALAAVGIHAADAAVGPRGGIEPPVSAVFHNAPVTLAAAVVGRRAAFDDFSDHVVERADEFRGVGVMALFKLAYLWCVAASAVVRRDDYGDLVAVVFKRRWIVLARLVARIAVHARFGVCAGFPLLDNARR